MEPDNTQPTTPAPAAPAAPAAPTTPPAAPPAATSVLIGDQPAPTTPPAASPTPTTSTGVEYEPTGDVGLDMALNFMGKQGLTADHPAMVAAQNGDFTILKATLAQKGAQGWEQFVALGEAAYTRATAEANTKAAAGREAIFKEVGGEDAWKQIQTWAGANATPEEKTEINALLAQGGLAARTAARYLATAYNGANNVVVNPADPLANAGRASAPIASNGPLDARAYANEVALLNRKLGGRMEQSREYATLQQRRAAYR